MLTQTRAETEILHRYAPPACVPAARSLRGGVHEPLAKAMASLGASVSYPRNAEIFGENEPAEYCYEVVSGSVRTYKVLSDGRRQIGGFFLPGDIFGLEFADEYTLSAEAVCKAKVLTIANSVIGALARRDNAVARGLFAYTSRELQRMQKHVLLLVKSAQQRVASFLVEMAERSPGNAIELPMSRQDIADYLGLTIETVSRTLTSLEGAGIIGLPTSRLIVVHNRAALNRLSG